MHGGPRTGFVLTANDAASIVPVQSFSDKPIGEATSGSLIAPLPDEVESIAIQAGVPCHLDVPGA